MIAFAIVLLLLIWVLGNQVAWSIGHGSNLDHPWNWRALVSPSIYNDWLAKRKRKEFMDSLEDFRIDK